MVTRFLKSTSRILGRELGDFPRDEDYHCNDNSSVRRPDSLPMIELLSQSYTDPLGGGKIWYVCSLGKACAVRIDWCSSECKTWLDSLPKSSSPPKITTDYDSSDAAEAVNLCVKSTEESLPLIATILKERHRRNVDDRRAKGAGPSW